MKRLEKDDRDHVHGVFEYVDTALPNILTWPLGVWEPSSSIRSQEIAFGAGPAEDALAPLWRANLSADYRLASKQLAYGEAKLEASRRVLEEVPSRLTSILQNQKAGLSFGRLLVATQLRPEKELLDSRGFIRDQATEASFGLGGNLADQWEATLQAFQGFSKQFQKSIAHQVWVESHTETQFLARTVAGWTGDLRTVFCGDISPIQALLHQRTVALALLARNTLIRTITLAVQAAVKLTLALGIPGGAILAIPIVLRFVHEVQRQISEQR
jgi:hypothetical protein